jgi:hypothetical protein
MIALGTYHGASVMYAQLPDLLLFVIHPSSLQPLADLTTGTKPKASLLARGILKPLFLVHIEKPWL